ncbi:PIN domain-containing protein [Maledivibacter halophilus]|uniref:DUF4935 domain-containing protein n=1 Tax=Maledivibacter halophilus TaxID=36842 RepID=A0A1T5MR00_9FIRM|nr:PIN domain-containing protein [Maledivibacter halophilus]SKC90433.1 hypothetical protein SAMN02194393_05162 [Maledivibacter halophilus]
MSDEMLKTAIVLDTNFIIEHIKDLYKILEKLSENFDVYVTEISINERISQKYLKLKSKYEKIESFRKEYDAYAIIKLKKTFEDRFDAEKKYTIKGYEEQFNDKIIRFNPSHNLLKDVMDRVYKKIPPFLNTDNASDKGFKDTLLWMSMMDFFKSIDENVNVIFISNDKGFINYAETLQMEFLTITGKKIDIRKNNYYKDLLGETIEVIKVEDIHDKELSVSEKAELRERISTVIYNICNVLQYDGYGDEYWEMAFETNTYFDNKKVKNAFENMEDIIADHILESDISASTIWGFDFMIKDYYKISIEYVEAAIELYKTIKSKYNEYMTPFLNAACEIINRNYREIVESNDDDLPF